MSRAGDLRNITATGTASEDNYVLTYDDATKKVSLEASAGGGDLVNDTTPQLGGDLDNNGKNIKISAASTGSGNNRLTVGPNAEFSLYHNASLGTYMVESGSGSMRFMASDFKLQNFAGSHEYIVMTDGGSVAISHGNGKKFETTTTGVTVTGTTEASVFKVGSGQYFDESGGNVRINNINNADILFRTGSSGNERMRIASDGKVGIGSTGPGNYYAKDLVVGAADEGGITIVNGTTEQGYLMFADGTGGSPDARFRGYIGYDHNIDHMQMTSGGILKFLVNNTTQAMTVDTSGRLTVGSIGTDTTLSGGQPAFQVTGSGFNGYMAAVRRDTSQYSSGIILAKSRSSTADNFTALADNDQIGSILFIGDDGTDLDTYGATIFAEVNGTPSANNMPTDLVFSTNSGTNTVTERMRIDTSGRLLVGKTSSNYATEGVEIRSNEILITKAGTNPISIRNNGNGGLISLNSAGTSIGTIGVESGNNLIVGGTVADHSGLLFGTNTIIPMQAGSGSDATQDLGNNGGRFKDLYLSGGLYVGGAVSANYLDDYEEGTWTPTITGYNGGSTQTYSTQTGNYIKIGNQIFANFYVGLTSKGNISGNYTGIGGLPFPTKTSVGGTGVMNRYNNLATSVSGVAVEMGGGVPSWGWLTRISGTSGTYDAYMTANDLGNSTWFMGTLIYVEQ